MRGDAAEAYAKETVAADFQKPGDDDVVEKVLGDFRAKGPPSLKRSFAMSAAALARARAEADSADARMTQVREDAVRQIVAARNALKTSLLALLSSAAVAAELDREPGFQLAQRLCPDCHGICVGALSPNPAAPSFFVVANQPSTTELSSGPSFV